MRNVKLVVVILLLFAAIAVPLVVRHRADRDLRAKNENSRQQAALIAKLTTENDGLLNARAASSQPADDAQFVELLELRNEVGRLRHYTDEGARLQAEISRIQQALKNIQNGADGTGLSPLALLADELPLREARLAQFRQWLEARPEQMIPEMQFLDDSSWMSSADWERVTGEELEGWASAQRSGGALRFTAMTYKALKLYGEANSGRFPTEVSQLKPYYEVPIDDAIFQRWEIVPAKSLSFLDDNWKGGDRVITERSPVNKRWDRRHAIGMSGWFSAVKDGRWDPVK